MWYKREISKLVLDSAAHFPAVVLTGARQSGKTTLLKKLFPDHTYVSLDIPSTAEMADKEPDLFLKRYHAPVLIDEVQYAPGLFRHLKSAIDQTRHEMGRYIITGSQKFPLMQEVSDSLAGRAAILELEHLSAREIASRNGRPENLDSLLELVARGGPPELWRNRTNPTNLYFGSYLSTYLERDVRQILNVSSLRDFERFIRACAARSGEPLVKSTLAREVGISLTAVTAWLSVLQASNQIAFLEPWFSNFGKRLVKTPKMYFCDTGLLCYLLGLTERNLATSPFVGGVWETFVYAELRKAARVSPDPVTLWFYRDKQQLEIDFLVLGGGHGRLVECKWTEHPDSTDTRNLDKLSGLVGQNRHPDFACTTSAVIARARDPYLINESTRVVDVFEMPRFLGLE